MMFNKPFKTPLLKTLPQHSSSAIDRTRDEPIIKRRRISDEDDEDEEELVDIKDLPKKLQAIHAAVKHTVDYRKPLINTKPLVTRAEPNPANADTNISYYNVLWRKPSAKKHKTWDGDGILIVQGGFARLQDELGKDMGKIAFHGPLLPGSSLKIGGKDVEVDSIVSKAVYQDIRRNQSTTYKPPKAAVPISVHPQKTVPSVPPKMGHVKIPEPTSKPYVEAPKSVAINRNFKNPLLSNTILAKVDGPKPTPRHDPHAENALVMRRPRSVPRGSQIVDVVVDPVLCKALRPHQREGIRFMYECVMGMRESGEGAILADEMGLGKTLQTIALLWTLLKQNPIYEAGPVIKKALIVCPVTLINNWRKEIKKWLGNERVGVFVADGAKINLRDFTMGRSYSIMIIGYERLRLVQEELKKGAGIDIVVADEGHRLKTAQNKSAQAILGLNTNRRIILSGTPIQNDLSEFFVMVDFVNPGLLGKYSKFKKDFEGPIIRSRQPEATPLEIERGEEMSNDLAEKTKVFILRRTAEVIAKFLPPKTETVVFCRPTEAQAAVYRAVLGSPVFGKVLGSPEASLQLITVLKKVCNSPSLLRKKSDQDSGHAKIVQLLSDIPANATLKNPASSSGKLQVLHHLLNGVRSTTEEKVVLVSNYTSTLDLLQTHLVANNWKFLRLDGSTPSSKRQQMVDTFNRTPPKVHFVFLLSAKSGGVGLNLIGASRLILFDVDWNPSTDLQAMARIHRDGQTREVRIYRLLTAGALDEKIYQRQLTKQGLADNVMDQKSSTGSFSRDELRDLFRLDTTSICQTHDLLRCKCQGDGFLARRADDTVIEIGDTEDEDDDFEAPPLGTLIMANKLDMAAQEKRIKEQALEKHEKKNSMQSLMQFLHIDSTKENGRDGVLAYEAAIDDDVLLNVLKKDDHGISYIFTKTSS